MNEQTQAKQANLRLHGALNRQPGDVSDPLFQGNDFFDAFDLGQVKYEMLRRVRVDGWSVAAAARAYGFSRLALYQAQSALTNVQEPFSASLSYSYDGDGNQTQVVDSFGGTQTSVYDVQDRLVTREYTGESEQMRVDFTYTAQGLISTQTSYSNLAGTALVATTTDLYDANGNVTSIATYDATSALIDQFTYIYDRAGNLSSETDTQQSVATTT